MANNGSKVHIKHEQLEHGITVNVFGDSAEEAMELLVDTINCIDGNTARDVARVDAAKADRAQPRNPQPAQAPRPTGNGGLQNTPTCPGCGTDEAVELITFTDRDTGEQKRRFKCTSCNKWLAKSF